MTMPAPLDDFSALEALRLAGGNMMLRLRGDEPNGVLAYMKIMEWLREASPEESGESAELSPEQAAEAIFTLAAQLSFALLEAPETAPAAFAGLVESWRAQHLSADETMGGGEAARAALRRYLDLSEADAARAAQAREG